MLPIHAQLFEDHRMNSIKQMLTRMLRSEIQAHCSAIEDLSAALSYVCSLDIPAGVSTGTITHPAGLEGVVASTPSP